MDEDKGIRLLHVVRGVHLDLDEVDEVSIKADGGIRVLLKCGQDLVVPHGSVNAGYKLLAQLIKWQDISTS